MKRRIWLIAGIVAILVTAWIIKNSQRSTRDDAEIPTAEPGRQEPPSDGATSDNAGSPQVAGPTDSALESQSSSTPKATEVTPGASADHRPAVNVPQPTDTAGNPVISSGSRGEQPDPQAVGNTVPVPGSPKTVTGVQIPAPGVTGRGSAPANSNQSGSSHQGTSSGGTALTQNSGANVMATPTAKPQPTPTPDVRLKASPAELSCDDQWKQHTSIFKVGADLAYMTTIAVQRPLAPDIAASHIETVSQSSSSTVKRDVVFSSDHPTGILVLTSINPEPELTTSKEVFLSLCQATGGRAVHSVLYKLSRAKVLDIADVNVKVGAGTFPAYQMKLEAALLINGKVVNATADIWMAKQRPGLTVKEVIKIPAKVFTDHGSITISSQLAGTRKI